MTAVSNAASRRGIPAGFVAARVALLIAIIGVAALTTEPEDWQPLSLFVALCAVMVVADTLAVSTRRIRFSAGLMVQVTVMALLGPAPAVASALLSCVIESRVNRVDAARSLNDLATFALLGLVGGLLFELVRAITGLDRGDVGYALLVLPIYLLIAGANLALVAAWRPGLAPADRVRIMRDPGLPALPLEVANGVFAAATVLVWASAGLVAAAGLLVMIVITIPLARTVGNALKHGDDLLALRAGVGRASHGSGPAGLRSHPASVRGAASRGSRARASRRVARTTARCSGWRRCGRTWPRAGDMSTMTSMRRSQRRERSSRRSIRRRSASSGSRSRCAPRWRPFPAARSIELTRPQRGR